MTGQDERSVVQSSPTDALPEYWPVNPPVRPVRAVWLPWPIAVVLAPLLWLLPKRVGVHFAAVRWPGAIVAHVVWTIYGIGCIAITYQTPRYSWVAYLSGQSPGQEPSSLWPPPTVSEIAGSPLAVLAWDVVHELTKVEQFLLGLGIAAAVEVGLVVLAGLLMPWAAAGERGRRLFGRCVKLTLWSTTSLAVLGLMLQAIELGLIWEKGSDRGDAAGVAVALYVGWFFWIWIRSGMRYAGPAEGPGWERRRPLCEDCGYILTGLAAADRCPECGSPVRYSLPSCRRPPAFAQAGSSRLARIPAFLCTFGDALVDPGFYERLPVRDGYPAARRFAIAVCLLGVPVMAAGYFAVYFLLSVQGVGFNLDSAAAFTMGWVGVTVPMFLIMSLIGVLGTGFGYRRLQPFAIILFYHSARLLLVAILTVIVLACVTGLELQYYRGSIHLWFLGRVDAGLVYAGLPFVLPLVLFLRMLAGLLQAVHQTRFANA